MDTHIYHMSQSIFINICTYVCVCEYPYMGFIQWEVKKMKAFSDWRTFFMDDEMVEWFDKIKVIYQIVELQRPGLFIIVWSDDCNEREG